MPDPIDFSSVFENLDDAACIIEQLPLQPNGLRNYRYIAVNKAFNSLFGTSGLIGQSIRETFPDEPEIWYEDFDRVLETGVPARFKRQAPSQRMILETYLTRLEDDTRNRLVAVMRNVTTQHEVEKYLHENDERQTFLLQLSDVFRTISDPHEIWQVTMRLLGEHLGLSRAYYFNVVANGNSWTHIIEPGYQKDPNALRFIGPYALENFNSEMFEGFARGEVIAAADIETLPGLTEAQRESYRAVGVAAFINVPLLRNGAYSAGIGAHFTTPHNWTQQEIDLIRELAARTWTAAEKATAEQSLQKSEEKYRTLFNSIDECFCIIQMIFDEKQNPVDYLVLEANPALYKLTGLTDAIGKSMRELAPAHEQFWYDKYGAIAVTGMPARFEHEAAALNRWYDVYAFPICEPQEMKVAVIFTDITDQKQRESQQEFLLKLSDTFRTLPDWKVIEETGSLMLADFLKLDRAYIFVLYPDDDRAIVRAEYRKDSFFSIIGEVRMSDFPETVRQIEDETIVFNDIDSDTRLSDLNRESLRAVNLQSFMCASVRKGEGNVLWSFAAAVATPRIWSNNEVALIETVAERIWAAAEQARAAEALRKSEKRLQLIANLVPDLLWDSEADGSTTWYNRRWLEYTGQSFEKAIGWGWVDAIHPDDRESSAKRYAEAVKAGKSLQQEHRIRRHDGEYRWFVVNTSPISDEKGQVIKVYGTATDIHDRKKAEQISLENARRQAFLLKLSDLLRPLTKSSTIQETAAKELLSEINAGWVYYISVDTDGDIISAMAGASKTEPLIIPPGTRLSAFGELILSAYNNHVTLCYNDTQMAPGFAETDRANFRMINAGALISVPLIKDGKLVALLSVAVPTPREWKPGEVNLIEEIAQRTWAAIERAKAEEALKKSEEKYRTLFKSVDEGFSILELTFNDQNKVVDFMYLENNPAFVKHVGMDLQGKRRSELSLDQKDFVLEKYQHLLDTGEPVHFEYSVQGLGAKWFQVNATRIGDENSKHLGIIFRNITEDKKHELNQAFLLRFSDELRIQPNADAVAKRALQLLLEHLVLDRTYITSYYLEEGRAILDYQTGNDTVPPLPDYFTLAEYPEAFKAIFNGTFVVEDELERQGLSEAERQNSGKLGMRARVAATLHKEDKKPIWSMVAISSSPRRWSPNEIKLIEDVAELTWTAIKRVRVETALKESEQRLRLFIEALPVGVGLYDNNGAFLLMNSEMKRYLPTEMMPSSDQTQQWRWQTWDEHGKPLDPENYPGARAISNDPVQGGMEMLFTDDKGHEKWIRVMAVPLKNDDGGIVAQVCVITDIDDLKRTAQALTESELRFRSFVAASSELVYRMSADWREMYLLSGENFLVKTNEPNTNWIDLYIPEEDRVLAWSAISEAIFRKEIFEFEHRIVRTDGSIGWAASRAIPILNDQEQIVEWIGAAANITDRKQAEQKLKHFNARLEKEIAERTAELKSSKELLQATLDSNPEMIQVFKALRNEEDNIIDFVWILVNAASEKIYGDVIGKRLLEITPGVYQEGIFDAFVTVTETGIPQQYEKNYVHEQFNGWYYQSVVKMDDGVATNTINITDRKLAELQLEKNRDQLQSILDTTLVQMSMMQAVRDHDGKITDFRITMVNKELERETNRTDLVGKLYAEEYPGIKETGLFNLIIKAVETGVPQATEYYYAHDGFNKWFSCTFVKMYDGVVATNMDITARKQDEEERFKNYLLLQQSEDLALLGSWEYNLLTGTFTWSDGMYRLFDLERGTEIQPEIYLAYATPECLEKAQRVVHYIRSGESRFEETLEINVSGQIKVLHLKATVVDNNEGRATRVLGVDMDISAMRAAEQKIRQMETEQQLEIFRVTLRTQEEERRRISESLHNGLGQLLYAIKISLSQLTARRLEQHPEEFESAKRYTSELIADAMRDTRQISHELMPPILNEFGLEAAVNDVCQRMQDGIRFHCSIELGDVVLDKYMQLAVFRTMQELMINVAKHAKATESKAEIFIADSNVLIRVSDNGIGMDASKQARQGNKRRNWPGFYPQ